MPVAPVVLTRFVVEFGRALVALIQPIALIGGVIVLDIIVLFAFCGWSLKSACFAVLSWFFGNGNIACDVNVLPFICLIAAALAGYSLLGLIVWSMTEVVKRSQE